MVIISFVRGITLAIFLCITWQLFKKCLYFLMHFSINIVVTFQHVYHRVWVKKGSSPNGIASDIGVLKEHIPRLRKPLSHLVVLADTERHCISDLARVVIWSLVAGVPYVSFHDVTGQLKKNEEKLFLEVQKYQKEVPGYVKWANKPDLNGYSNGIREHTVIFHIFNSNDGRPKIAECVSRIAEERAKIMEKNYQITVEEFDTRLSSLYPSIPDPDLIFFTGPSCISHGFLPWQLRLAEFVQLSLDHSINVNKYVGALCKYNNYNQRFGK